MPAEPASRRIFVVDDDQRDLLATALGDDGHTVDGARDGGEALALHPDDLVLRIGTCPGWTVPLPPVRPLLKEASHGLG